MASFYATYRSETKEEKFVGEIDVTVETKITGDGSTSEPLVTEQVNTKERISVVTEEPKAWWTLLTGAPNPKNLVATAATFLVNAMCVIMITDMVYSPSRLHPVHDLSFARIGYVSDAEAKLLIREPDQAKMPVTVQVAMQDPRVPSDNLVFHTAGGVRWTAEESDFTAVVTIPLTHSSQRTYQWTTSNNHSGEFTAAPRAGKMPELFDGKFTFLSTSCIVPRLPYNLLDHPLALPGARHLAKLLPTFGAQFMLFLGDFIYIDVPQMLGDSVESYRQKYRQVYASPEWPAIGQNISWIHVLDDHEIRNDWDAKSEGVYETAVDPWHHYQTSANPPAAIQAGSRGLTARKDATYFSFTQGPATFFMLDTRSYRSKNSEPFDSTDKSMLGAAQLEDFLEWLSRPVPKGVKWKFVASSIPFTKNWRVNTRDTWGGFLVERRRVLEAMWDASRDLGVGIVILSGDRHEFGATAFPPPPALEASADDVDNPAEPRWPESATVHEFSASPLNQFFSPIGTYRQTDNEDVKLKYINWGNSKFGAVEIENLADGEQSSLKYTVYIDGKDAWSIVLTSPLSGQSATSSSFWGRFGG